jgi:hypothetical protein
MFNRLLASAALVAVSSVASAQIAIQGAMATGGVMSIGLVQYTPSTEIGVTASGSFNNADDETKTFTPVVFAGLRESCGEQTFFAYGIDLADTFGDLNGSSIKTDIQVGPYISLEQMLTPHIMLSGWILPYQYEYLKVDHVSVTTHDFFSAGGIAINYLF